MRGLPALLEEIGQNTMTRTLFNDTVLPCVAIRFS